MLQTWEVEKMVNEHNKSINDFIYGELAERLNAKNGKVSLDQWFKAQAIIKEQNFYDKGMDILRKCRDAGFNVKMNMQSNELVYYGTIEPQEYVI